MDKITRVLIVSSSVLFVLAVCSTLFGCAFLPYSVSFHQLQENPGPWLTDGPDASLTAYNNTNTLARLTIECAGAPEDWVVEVNPHSEVHALGQLMAVNTRGDACFVKRVETLTMDGWKEIPAIKWHGKKNQVSSDKDI